MIEGLILLVAISVIAFAIGYWTGNAAGYSRGYYECKQDFEQTDPQENNV